MTFFFNSTSCLADAFTKQTAEGIQLGGHLATRTASHLPWGHTLLHTSPRMHFFCKWLDSSPAFTLQMRRRGGGQGSVRLQPVTEGRECGGKGGRDTECTGRLVGQNAAAGSTAAQGSGQARKCFVPSLVSSSIPGRLEPSPATQHRNVLCAALAHSKIELR